MESTPVKSSINPPKLIPTLTQGMTTVANHIYLILPSVALDLFLWLGPHLSFEKVLQGLFDTLKASMAAFSETSTALDSYSTLVESIKQLNFFSFLRGMPIGVPSLMQWAAGMKTPLGDFQPISVPSSGAATLWLLGLSILGIVFGALYLYLLSVVTSKEKVQVTFRSVSNVILQSLLLSLAMIVAFLVLLIPVSLFSDILLTMAPGLSQIVMFVVGIFIIWLIMPLIFSGHGIFAEGKNAFQSIMQSIIMVRTYLPGTGMFALVCFVIYFGLNALWSKPPIDSWFLLVGILGHAFIAAALFAASFFFYRDGLAWMNEKIRQAHAKTGGIQS